MSEDKKEDISLVFDKIYSGKFSCANVHTIQKYIDKFESKISSVEKELEVRKKQMSSYPFCSDHRDKVFNDECKQCEIERLNKALSLSKAEKTQLLDWVLERAKEKAFVLDIDESVDIADLEAIINEAKGKV